MEPMNSNPVLDASQPQSQARRVYNHQESFLPDPALKMSYTIYLQETNREYLFPHPIFSWIYKFRTTKYGMWAAMSVIFLELELNLEDKDKGGC